MNEYCCYSIQCGFDGDESLFKENLFKLLKEYETKTGVVVTAYIVFGVSMYPGKYPCSEEPIASVQLSTNPYYVKDVSPHVEKIATQLANLYGQNVLPCYPIAKAEGTFSVKKSD